MSSAQPMSLAQPVNPAQPMTPVRQVSPAQVLLIAKAPVAGRVKTRLCPPCTPEQAAAVAAAALADTIDVVSATPAVRRVLAIEGDYPTPPGWTAVRQRGTGLGERLAHAFTDTALPGTASVLIGMDTPQVTVPLLVEALEALAGADAALGVAVDGGWWVLALRDPRHASALADVPMSTAQTGELTRAALRRRGLTVATVSTLRDIDTAADAWQVAARCPGGRFADAVRQHIREAKRPAVAAPTASFTVARSGVPR